MSRIALRARVGFSFFRMHFKETDRRRHRHHCQEKKRVFEEHDLRA